MSHPNAARRVLHIALAFGFALIMLGCPNVTDSGGGDEESGGSTDGSIDTGPDVTDAYFVDGTDINSTRVSTLHSNKSYTLVIHVTDSGLDVTKLYLDEQQEDGSGGAGPTTVQVSAQTEARFVVTIGPRSPDPPTSSDGVDEFIISIVAEDALGQTNVQNPFYLHFDITN